MSVLAPNTQLNEVTYGAAYKRSLETVTSFLDGIPDQSSKIITTRVGDPIIVVSDLTPTPEVLVNHIGTIPDMDLTYDGTSIKMARLDTKNTPITDEEANTTSIDLAKEVISGHALAIEEKRKSLSCYALAPLQNTAATPVIPTTGTSLNNRGFKKFTESDLDSMYEALTDENTPEDGLIAVLTAGHIRELCEDSNGVGGFNAIWKARKPGDPVYYGGFWIYKFNSSKHLNYAQNGTKNAFGTPLGNSDRRASFFFNKYECARFETSAKIYRKNSSDDPDNRATKIGVRKYALLLPINGRSYGAVYEG